MLPPEPRRSPARVCDLGFDARQGLITYVPRWAGFEPIWDEPRFRDLMRRAAL